MNCNVGGLDMTARIVIGVILLGVGLFVPMNVVWQTVVLVLAAIGLVTGIIRYCPLNSLIGLNTCRSQEKSHQSGG